MTTYPIAEHEHTINGVTGRMFTIHAPQEVRGNMVHRNQTWKSLSRPVTGYGTNGQMSVTIRFDDECQNGHQSFSITADVYTAESRRQKDIAAGGCMHEEIAKIFPELAPLTKWHLTSTDGPMHYVANTLYHASGRDASGRRAGEPSSYAHGVRFGSSPLTQKIEKRFYDWLIAAENFNATALKTNPDYVRFEPVAVSHGKEKNDYSFADKYTFKGYDVKWHECPFDTINEAEEFCAALRIPHQFVMIPTAYSTGKTRDLDAARSCAVWPEATDEELTSDTLKAALEARLPALMAEFRETMNRIGFLWEPTKEPVQ